MVIVLGFSKVDCALALRWLHWVSWLCMKEGGDSSSLTLVLFGTRSITESQWDLFHRMHYHSDCMFRVEPVVCRDERENGYPGCATHLFYRALEYCETKHAGEPILWCEPDTVALKAGWAQSIAKEYAACGKAFLGVQSGAMVKHMPGVACYPANWRALSPCMDNMLNLPDIPMWGRGKSQAWDTACAHQIVPQMAVARTIFQVWRPRRIDRFTMDSIPKTAVLFHQDKLGRMPGLIDLGYRV